MDRQKELDRRRKYNKSHRKGMAEYNYSRNRKVKEFIRTLKDQPCADCRIKYPYYVMDFDHISGVKKFGMGKIKNNNIEAILDEVLKCDVVCSNCHRVREWKRRVK